MVSSATTTGINSNGPAGARASSSTASLRVPCLFSSGSAFFGGKHYSRSSAQPLAAHDGHHCMPCSSKYPPERTHHPSLAAWRDNHTIVVPTNLVTALVVITKS